MSDPNEKALAEAKEDARQLGVGYLRINRDGSFERLEPASIAFPDPDYWERRQALKERREVE